MVASVFIPYLYACGIFRGLFWKGLGFYAIYREVDALYDIGMYISFFLRGPGYIKSIMKIEDEKSFGKI